MSSNAMSIILEAATTGLWALVDPALCPELLTHHSTRGTRYVLPLPGLAVRSDDADAVVPYLLQLNSDPVECRHQLDVQAEWALQSHGASWLQSDLPGGELADMLGRRMDAMLSDRQAALLRFADARVLPVLHSVLSEEQRQGFLAPVSRWWHFDRQEQLTTIEGPSPLAGGPSSANDPWVTPWVLDREQEAAMLTAAEADTVIALLLIRAKDAWEQVPRAERHAFVSGQIARAVRCGIEAAMMQATFCAVALSQGEAFSDQPSWQAALDKVRSGTWELPQAIESVLGSSAA